MLELKFLIGLVMAERKFRQVPDVLREVEDEASKLDAKRLGSRPLTNREKKRYTKLNRFFNWLLEIGFYHKLNNLSPYTHRKALDEMLAELKENKRS